MQALESSYQGCDSTVKTLPYALAVLHEIRVVIILPRMMILV